MLSTAAAIFSAIGLLMPGFIIAELSIARSARGSRSELELALRALSYALVLHVIFGFWTVGLISRIGRPEQWTSHLGALTAYGAVVLIAVPVIVGAALNRYLAYVEDKDGATQPCSRLPSEQARPEMPSTLHTSGGEEAGDM